MPDKKGGKEKRFRTKKAATRPSPPFPESCGFPPSSCLDWSFRLGRLGCDRFDSCLLRASYWTRFSGSPFIIELAHIDLLIGPRV